MVPQSIETRPRGRRGPPPGYGTRRLEDHERAVLLDMEAAGLPRRLMEALVGMCGDTLRRELGCRGAAAAPRAGLPSNAWHWPDGTVVRQRESRVLGIVEAAFAGPGGRHVLLLRTGRGPLVEYADPDLIEIVNRRVS